MLISVPVGYSVIVDGRLVWEANGVIEIKDDAVALLVLRDPKCKELQQRGKKS